MREGNGEHKTAHLSLFREVKLAHHGWNAAALADRTPINEREVLLLRRKSVVQVTATEAIKGKFESEGIRRREDCRFSAVNEEFARKELCMTRDTGVAGLSIRSLRPLAIFSPEHEPNIPQYLGGFLAKVECYSQQAACQDLQSEKPNSRVDIQENQSDLRDYAADP